MAVRSIRASPSTRSWGSTVMTRTMEVRVPRPRVSPMEEIMVSVDSLPMRKPATVMMEPEVSTVGKLWLSASTAAARRSSTVLSCK